MANTLLHAVLDRLFELPAEDGEPLGSRLEQQLERRAASAEGAVCALNAAFLLALAGPAHRASEGARAVLDQPPPEATGELIDFYRRGMDWIVRELDERSVTDRQIIPEASDGPEALWPVLFPEGVGILGHQEERIAELRAKRTVSITQLNPRPLSDPARQILFTSNVLLTVPAATTDLGALPYPEVLRRQIRLAATEPQERWYDHPIQIGVEPDRNELIYGLRGLDRAIEFERSRNSDVGRITVVLSVSVTHGRLSAVAHDYVREELRRSGGLNNLDVQVFTEGDTRRLVQEVLGPVAGADAEPLLATVFGTWRLQGLNPLTECRALLSSPQL